MQHQGFIELGTADSTVSYITNHVEPDVAVGNACARRSSAALATNLQVNAQLPHTEMVQQGHINPSNQAVAPNILFLRKRWPSAGLSLA